MKKLFVAAVLLCVAAVAPAQMVIKENGKVCIGRADRPNDDQWNVLKAIVYGDHGEYNAGAKLAFGDFGQRELNGWNVFVGEWDTVDSDILWLHGKNGIRMTTLNGTRIVGLWGTSRRYFTPHFTVYDEFRADRLFLSSEDRNKTSIRNMSNTLSKLKKLNSISFRYKPITNYSLLNYNEKELTEKEKKDIEFAESVIKAKEKGDARYGFMTKEVAKLFPELVITDDDGNQYVDYVGFIPVMVSAIQELAEKSNNGNNGHGNNGHGNNGHGKPHGDGAEPDDASVIDYAVLYQANVYKHTDDAIIEYYLPKEVKVSELHFMDLTGSLIASYQLYDRGEGKFVLKGETLKPGMYLYSLVVDDEIVETKQLMLK